MLTSGGLRSARVLAAGTALRILLVPVVMALVLADDGATGTTAAIAAVVFFVAAATDYVDGYLARRWDVTTTLGSFLDTTADKLLVTGVLVALVAVERASPWIARDHRRARARDPRPAGRGARSTAAWCSRRCWARARRRSSSSPSCWPSCVPATRSAALYIDEWAMLVAAAVTRGLGGRLPRPLLVCAHRASRAPLRPRLRHRRHRADRRRARRRGWWSAGTTSSRWRAPTRAAAALAARGAAVARGDVLDEDALARGDARLRARLPRRRGQHAVPDRPGGALPRQRARGRGGGARRGPRRRGRARADLVGVGARRGGGHGRAARTRRIAARSCRPTSAPSTTGEVAALAAARRADVELVERQPVLGAGPGPRRRHRAHPARLPQRPPEGLRRHARSAWSTSPTPSRGTCWPPSAGSRASATSCRGATLTSREALAVVSER